MRLYTPPPINNIDDPKVRRALRYLDDWIRDAAIELVTLSTPPKGNLNPTAASYITVNNEVSLSAERRLSVSSPLTAVDGGANGQFTLGFSAAGIAGIPALTLSTTNAAGAAATFIRTDATVATFDTVAPSPLASVAATGGIGFAARRDHVHAFPPSLQSLATLFTLTLTDDGTNETLTGSNGGLTITPANNLLNLAQFNAGGGSAATNTALMQFVGLTSVVGTTPTVAISGSLTWNAAATYSGVTHTGILASVTHGPSPIFTNAILRALDVTATISSQSTNAGQTWTEKTGLNITNNAASQSGAGSGTVTDSFGIKITMATTIGTAMAFTNAYGARIPVPNYGGTIRRGIYVLPSTTNFGTEAAAVEGVFIDTVGRGLTTRRSIGAVGATLGTPTDVVVLDQTTVHGVGTNRYFLRGLNRSNLSNPNGQGDTVLELRQLNTGANAGAHLNLDDKAGDPPAPNTGDIWRNSSRLMFEMAASPTDLGATQPYVTGSYTIPDGFYRIVARQAAITGTQRITVLGTGLLRVA